jgi:hypothetical protein
VLAVEVEIPADKVDAMLAAASLVIASKLFFSFHKRKCRNAGLSSFASALDCFVS